MNRNHSVVALAVILLLAAFCLLTVACGSSAGGSSVTYNPPKPEDAPQDMREAVLLGRDIVSDTQKYAAQYVGNKLNCGNCHFEAGRTKGGANGGLTMVGTAATYPQYRERHKWTSDIEQRISDCFQRSMNGTAPAMDSKEMQAVAAYIQWLSKGIPVYADVGWLHNPALKQPAQPNADNGKQAYATTCAPCHGPDGQGISGPPLWGNGSYNDGAGMAKAETLATFAHLNMPYMAKNPSLTPQQAWDIATFVDSQPRPKFQAKQ